MKSFLPLLFLLFSLKTLAQNTEGVVTYERVQHWTAITARLTFLSQEEKDRAKNTWGSTDEWKEKMKLSFSPTRSVYTYLNDRAESEDGAYTWRNRDYLIARNFEKETQTDLMEMLGKTYLLEDSLRTPAWKISNQIKEVAGYQCVRATTEDPIRKQKITAWFAQEIPVPAGPERYFGLPGVILELDLNEGDVVITATKVEFRPVEKDLILPKMKGKKITQPQYNALIKTHIDDSIKSHRNPYWSLRY